MTGRPTAPVTPITAIGSLDSRVRLLHRVGRKGLASAFIEGVRASIAPYVAAMDGDLQHDERILPAMLDELRSGRAEIVVGSRYIAGGGLGEWDKTRAGMSDMATRLSRLVLRTHVTDPMSGFFMLPRTVFERAAPRLSAIGFKILLDVIASLPKPPKITELPYTFRTRVAGESKLDAGVLFDFGLLLLDKMVGKYVPVRFVMFAIIGVLGLAGHLLILAAGLGGIAAVFHRAGDRHGMRDRRQLHPQQRGHLSATDALRAPGAFVAYSSSQSCVGSAQSPTSTWRS